MELQLLWTALQLPVHLPVFTKKDVRKSRIIIPVGSIQYYTLNYFLRAGGNFTLPGGTSH